jgi:hypothetical protein
MMSMHLYAILQHLHTLLTLCYNTTVYSIICLSLLYTLPECSLPFIHEELTSGPITIAIPRIYHGGVLLWSQS